MNWVLRNWLIVAVLLTALTTLASILEFGGFYLASALLLAVGWMAVGFLALADGVLRALGRSSLLGSGEGFGRVLALAQIVLALLLLAGLLVPIP